MNSPCSCCRWCAGQFPELRRRPTLEALQRLAQAGLMPQETADAAGRAYVFLRRVEHRIQYLDDQQTHVLPTRDDDLAWIASTMGYQGLLRLLHELDAHRELVAQEFDTAAGRQRKSNAAAAAVAAERIGPATARAGKPAGTTARRLSRTRGRVAQQPRAWPTCATRRARLFRIVQRTAQWLGKAAAARSAGA